MINAVIGRKCGMTQIFTEAGIAVPVTVIHVPHNRVTQVKDLEKEGYQAIQVTSGEQKPSRVNRPLTGHYAKAETKPGRILKEFRVSDPSQYTLGQTISLDIFSEGQHVDVTAISKGKGFAGTVKRHNFKCQPMSHGNSRSHRVPGSTGQNQSPRKVFKGKKMAGQMGNVICTVQNQTIVRVDQENSLLMVKGVVPGPKGGDVVVRHAVKHTQGGN